MRPTGNQSRERLRTWLSPLNPSTNHNIACNIHQDGTAMWFTRGSTFEEWKKNGSILWILGNHMLLSLLGLHGYSFLLQFDSGIRQKHPLVCGPSATLIMGVYLLISSAIIEDIKCLQEVKSTLITYHYFDFKDATKCHLRSLLSSLLMQLSNHSFAC
jgi:hypothetical protein